MTATAIEVRERGIPFTAEMVKAILEDRKTMTRRVMKVQPDPEFQQYPIVPWKVDGEQQFTDSGLTLFIADYHEGMTQSFRSQYSVGDHLWVKETYGCLPTQFPGPPHKFLYRADGDQELRPIQRWKGGRFMPKVAARLWLEVTDVRVERLQSISLGDIEAEGTPPYHPDDQLSYRNDGYQRHKDFRHLWDKINGDRPGCRWVDNPWIWVYSFRRIEQ